MATDHDDDIATVVAFVSGTLIGVAATLLFVRMQNRRHADSRTRDDDYHFDGGDIFI